MRKLDVGSTSSSVPARSALAQQRRRAACAGAAAVTGALLKGEPGHVDALLLRSRAYIHLADLDLAKRHLGEVLFQDL